MDGRGELASRLALIVITDARCGDGRELVDVVRASLAGGAPAIQLRAKDLTAREMTALALRLGEETRRVGALFFVNDRVDVALASGADGAHLGDDDLPIEAARRITPEGFILGRSVDTAEEAAIAVRSGADYLGVGPVVGTPSKPDTGPVIGIDGVGRVARAVTVPVVAIGGLDEGNAAAVAEAGAAGVAVIRAVMLASDPRGATESLLTAVARGHRE